MPYREIALKMTVTAVNECFFKGYVPYREIALKMTVTAVNKSVCLRDMCPTEK